MGTMKNRDLKGEEIPSQVTNQIVNRRKKQVDYKHSGAT